MADFNELESKLADWFKYVDRQAEAVKHAGATPQADEEEPTQIISKTPVPEEPEAVEQIEEQDSVIVERPRFLGQRRTPPPEILEEPEVPDIEDFLPFLKDRREESRPEPEARPKQEEKPAPTPPEPKMAAPPSAPPAAPPKPPVTSAAPPASPPEPPVTSAEQPVTPLEPPISPAVPEPAASQLEPGQPEPEDQRTLFFSEGTGTPRPRPKVHEEPVEQLAQQPEMETPEKNAGLPQSEAVESELSAVSHVEQPSTEELSASRARRVWEELPIHTKLLLGPEKKEVTQNSYKDFKETRQELIQRLLDPSLSLEEVARILNVCPTTVRRYTNRQLLPHFRTAGNQRRFRLSDVLAFLEENYCDMPEA